jgi:O-antigen/teichoic acid export membrane protein
MARESRHPILMKISGLVLEDSAIAERIASSNGQTVLQLADPHKTVDPIRQKYFNNLGDIARQSSIYFAGSAFTLLAGYLFRIVVARELGAELLGWNALGMGLYGLCKLLGQMGLPQTAVKFVASYAGRKETHRLSDFFWRGLFCTVAGTASFGVIVFIARHWISARVFHAPGFALYLPLFAILIPVGATNAFLLQTLCGFRKVSRSTAITSFMSFPCMMLLTIAGFALGLSLFGYVAAQLAAEALTLILAAISLRRLLPQVERWNDLGGGPLQPEMRRFAISMFSIGFLEFVLSQADRLIAGSYLAAKQVGIYAVAGSATAILAIMLQSVNSIFGPTIANLHAQGEYRVLGYLFETLTKWILGLSIPLILLFMIWSRSLMGLFGADFQAGSSLLVILCFGQAVNCGTGSVGYLLLMSGHQKEMIRGQLIFGILLLIADWNLIPVAGVRAAAVVSALGTAAINLYCLTVVRRRLGLFPYSRSYFKLVCPGLAAAATIWAARMAAVARHSAVLPSIIFALVFGYGIFLASLLLFGVDDDDRALIEVGRARISAMFAG